MFLTCPYVVPMNRDEVGFKIYNLSLVARKASEVGFPNFLTMTTPKKLSDQKTKSLRLAKQARGTFETVLTMIEKDAYCPEIIQQIESSIGLLSTIKRELLAGHLNNCVVKQIKENKNKAVQELLKIYNLLN